MLDLIAIAPESGWAYVREGEKIRLVRPPYVNSMLTIADELTVEKAVGHFGFSATQEGFEDWNSLIGHLNTTVREARESLNRKISEKVGEEFLKVASPDDLTHFLDQVENELLPNRRWEHAENVLLSMLGVSCLPEHPELYSEAIRLLDEARNGSASEKAARNGLLDEGQEAESVSPRADARFGKEELAEYARTISEQRRIFAFV